MNITTYNSDGTVLKEEICNIKIPEHIMAFNEDAAPYSYNTGDIELINSKKHPLPEHCSLNAYILL